MRAFGGSLRPAQKGFGIGVGSSDDGSLPLNRIYRNTIARTPGASLWAEVDAHRAEFRNNVIAWSGVGPGCYALDAAQSGNYFQDAPIPVGGIPFADPDLFVKPFSTTSLLCAVDDGDPAPPHIFTGAQYDYRFALSQHPALTDKAGTDPFWGDRDSNRTGYYGGAFDPGSDEVADGHAGKVFLREHDSAAERDSELFPGSDWWLSPDISVSNEDTINNWSQVGADGALPEETPFFSRTTSTPTQSPRLLLRVRSNQVISGTEPIGVRIFGALYNTQVVFPTDFRLYVDKSEHVSPKLLWRDAIETGPSPTGGSYAIFSFPFAVEGARNPKYGGDLEHFCLRAEVSVAGDRRPPFFTPPFRSNNIAHRNIRIRREPVEVDNFLFSFFSELDAEFFYVDVEKKPNRPTYLYVPNDPADIWTWDSPSAFPPQAGALFPLDNGTNEIKVVVPRSGLNRGQILVDSRTEGPPGAGERILVRQGDGGFLVKLGSEGTHESFEWGLPADWVANGLWTLSDRFLPSCGDSRVGHRSVAFQSQQTCTYETGERATGRLSTGKVLIDGPNRRLVFHHWAETENYVGFDVMRVILVHAGVSTLLKEWSGTSICGPGVWIRESFSMADFAGEEVEIVFEFDSVDALMNDFSGWHIDDVSVL